MNTTPPTQAITFWHREQQQLCEEKIFGESGVRFVYQSSLGRILGGLILKRRLTNHLMGWYFSSALSRGKVQKFVQDFDIPLDQFETGPFPHFNAFFSRRLAPKARQFAQDPHVMPAFAEGRFLAWTQVSTEQSFPVKGHHLLASEVLGSAERAADFENGPLVIARLCPVDYHRFHYPADGEIAEFVDLPGSLHSVNPIALACYGDILCRNHRRVTIIQSKKFGKLAYVEVGAMGVGKIVQTHDLKTPCKRGEEKGYFEYGGSTVMLFGQAGRWQPDSDLLKHTAEQREVYLQVGAQFAHLP